MIPRRRTCRWSVVGLLVGSVVGRVGVGEPVVVEAVADARPRADADPALVDARAEIKSG